VVTNCDHLGKSKFSRTLPIVFTEHGAIQAANVINSERALEIGVYVVRAFVHLRELVLSNKDLAQRLTEQENKADLMELKHDTFEHNTRVQLKKMFEAIRELMKQPELEPVKKRSIGFIELDEKTNKPKAVKAKIMPFFEKCYRAALH
jgi:hypothetical protein